MAVQTVTLDSFFIRSMIDHALKELPNECCGVLVGKAGTILRTIPVKSINPSPDAYSMDPEEQIAAYTEMDKRGESLLGIYHSHPDGPSTPSATDLQLAFHPDVIYFIISLKEKNHPCVRAFVLEEKHFREIPVSIADNQKAHSD